MEKILPIIIICSVGLAVCAALLIVILIKHLRTRRKNGGKEEFDMDDNTLTVRLGKKDLRK